VFHLEGCCFNHVSVIVESVHPYVGTFDKESARLVQESSRHNSVQYEARYTDGFYEGDLRFCENQTNLGVREGVTLRYTTPAYASFDASANPCISNDRFSLLWAVQRGIRTRAKSGESSTYTIQRCATSCGIGASQSFFSNHNS